MVITVTGANSYMLRQVVHATTAEFEAAHGDMALERLDGQEASVDRMSEALTSLPFLSVKKLVIITQGSANKAFTERAPELLAEVPDTTDVLLIEPKLDKRSSYYKYLKKATDYREYNELDSAALARWLTQAAKERGGSLKPADASFIVNRVGLNQQLLSQELDKLLLYSDDITRESIEALTDPTPQSTIFELLDAAFAGNTARILNLYTEQRALKVEPQQIIAMLSWQLHVLALIKTAGERTPETIAREAKLSPYVVKKSQGIANKLTLSELKQLLADLITIDTRSKRQAFNLDDALQHYLLALAA